MCKQYTCSCEFILMLITFTYKFIIIMLICRGAATDSGSPGQHIFELVTWHTTKYGDPYSEFVLCIWPILSAHTQQWTHTRSSGQPFMLRRREVRGAVGGSVSCSRAPQSWYWGWRECCTFTPPTYNSCRPETRTHNLSITSPTL